jgi:DNA polymerase-3 subunit alpha
MVALYRPGPMEWIPDYIAGKHQKKKVSYLHPKLAPILEKTYGVAIYQEQVMQIARDLAGFSMGQADVLRKAMGKKIASLLTEQKEKFIEGCVKNGVYKELGEKVFSFIEPFAGYGFNRSHAACYALIGYQTAYLKAHWPVEFMAALLTADQGDTDRIAIEIEECRSMGLKIMAPDINESFASFTVVTAGTKENRFVSRQEKVDTIRFGLKAIKNVGEHIADTIIQERKQNGSYADVFDLLTRITDRDLNKKSLESLIKSGALDGQSERGQLLANLEKLLNFNKEEAKARDSRQNSLFADLPLAAARHNPALAPAAPAVQSEKLIWEKELLGLYVSEHPFNFFKNYLGNYVVPLASLSAHKADNYLILAGVVSNLKKIITRSGESMLFVKIEDAVKTVEVLVFPRLYKETQDLWQPGRALIIDGKVSEKDRELKILVNRAALLDPDAPQKSIDDFKRLMLAGQAERRSVYNNLQTKSLSNNRSGAGQKLEADLKAGSAQKPVAVTVGQPVAKRQPAMPTVKSSSNSLRLIFRTELASGELEKLKEIFAAYPGNDQVYFKIIVAGKARVFKTAFKVSNQESLIKQIEVDFFKTIKIAAEP